MTLRLRLIWTTLAIIVFCALSMAFLDRPVALFFKAHVDGGIEAFFKTITRLGEAQLYLVPTGLMWIGLMIAGLRTKDDEARTRWRRLSFPPGFMFLAIALSGILSNVIKVSLGRYRPRYMFQDGLYGFNPFSTEWGMNSFPSGHSQAAFAAMTALAVIFPRWRLAWFTIAVLVASSRVVTTVHWLSDAVAGSFLAIAVTLLLARAFAARGVKLNF